WLDSFVPATTLLAAVPYFWLALVLVYIFATTLHWFPAQGGYDVTLDPGWTPEFIASAIQYGFLPAMTIVIASIGGWLLGMRNMMVSTLSE
ncbi:ABC transporter permease subunit, partial [Bacillus sp. SIMBA_074]